MTLVFVTRLSYSIYMTTREENMTTKERAKAIRKALKAKGWNAKKISVRVHSYSMGASINVTIKDASIARKTVEAIANGFQRIDRCAYSGEILGGCNTYVSVSYASGSLDGLKAIFRAELETGAENFLGYYVTDDEKNTEILLGRIDEDGSTGGLLPNVYRDQYAGEAIVDRLARHAASYGVFSGGIA